MKTYTGTWHATMKVCWNILICMWMGVIHGAVHVNAGKFLLTSSPLTPTDGELFTLTCSVRDNSTVNVGWLQNNKLEVATQETNNCSVQALNGDWGDIISRINVSCNSTIHSIAFEFNSSTDKGSAWQCGKLVNDTKIYPRSDNYTIGTEEGNQTLSTTTLYTETKPDPNTVMPKKAFTDEHLYIVLGAVGGAVLFTVVVVGVVCIRRRRKDGHQQNDMKEERNKKASPVYQNTTGNNTVENDVYEGSRDVQPMNAAENQEDDFMLSDAYASVDMPVTNTCTPREEVPSGDVNLENLYAKPDKSKHTEDHHDIYAVVQKPKKKE